MTKCLESSKIILWNPITGCSFSKDNETCPLRDISLAVTRKVCYLVT